MATGGINFPTVLLIVFTIYTAMKKWFVPASSLFSTLNIEDI